MQHVQSRWRSERHRMTPNWMWTLNSQSTLYTLNTYRGGPNFGPFRSTVSRFLDTTCIWLAKIGNAPNDPKVNTWPSNVRCINQILTHEVQILVRFALRLAFFSEIHGRQKRQCTEWPQTELEHRTVKSTLYVSNTYPEAQILVRFALRPVSKILRIISFPIDYHVKRPKKEQNNMPKIQNVKFLYSFNNFVRDLPQVYTWILGSKSGLLFQRRCRLKLLPPYGREISQFFEQLW